MPDTEKLKRISEIEAENEVLEIEAQKLQKRLKEIPIIGMENYGRIKELKRQIEEG